MFRCLAARARVLASVLFVLTLNSACTDATMAPDLGANPPAEGVSDDIAFARRSTGGGASWKGDASSVEIAPDEFSVTAGTQTSLKAVVRNRVGHLLDLAVTWHSSDPTVATVSGGTVKGLKAGTTLVTATVDGVSDTATAQVTTLTAPVDSIIVAPSAASVVVGQSLLLAARPVDTAGTALTNRAITWTTSNAAIAKVASDGRLTGMAAGTATVKATAEGVSSTVAVTVSPVPAVPVATVTVSPAEASVAVGAGTQLSAVMKDADGATLTGRTVTWATSNDKVAKVSATGLVTGVGAGSATITATSEGKSDVSAVTVPPTTIAVATVSMSVAADSIVVGGSAQLVATPKDAAGSPLTGRTITWASSKPTVASVSTSGLVKGLTAGTASITATVDGKVGTTAMLVAPAPIEPDPAPTPSEPAPTPEPEPAPAPTERVGYYVSPTGSAGASGTKSSPWDLNSVLRGSKAVAPGDTVWVLGGTYRGAFINYLNGTSTRQIVVRQYPGQRATIDGDLLVLGSYTTFWGLEVMNSNPLASYKIGVNVKSPGSRMINLVVHDAGASGVGLWNEAPNAVLYGSIVYNNGSKYNQDHGVYFNGITGTKYVQDNIVFNNYAYGLHAYSPISGELSNLRIDGNTTFNNGSTGPDGRSIDLHVGGSLVSNTSVTNNMTWRRNDGEITMRLLDGQNVSMSGNRAVGNYVISSSWSRSGDLLWSSSAPPTSGLHVIVRRNAYEAGRANVIVYNWAGAGSASADLSSVLRVGDTYEVRNAQNFYATPVARGTYGGGSISLPMTAIQPLPLIGRYASTPTSTGTVFHAFVVIKTN